MYLCFIYLFKCMYVYTSYMYMHAKYDAHVCLCVCVCVCAFMYGCVQNLHTFMCVRVCMCACTNECVCNLQKFMYALIPLYFLETSSINIYRTHSSSSHAPHVQTQSNCACNFCLRPDPPPPPLPRCTRGEGCMYIMVISSPWVTGSSKTTRRKDTACFIGLQRVVLGQDLWD